MGIARRKSARASGTLAAISALALMLALIAGYASSQFFNSDNFADRATSVLDDESVRSEIAKKVTDDVVLNADSDLVGVRPVIESVVDGIVGGGAFQSLFRGAVRDVHSSIFEGNRDSVTLTLVDAGVLVRGALQAVQPKAAKKIPAGANLDIENIDPPSWLPALLRVADRIGLVQWIALLLSLLTGAAAFALAPDRRRATLRFAVSLVVIGVLGAVALGVAEALLARTLDAGAARDAGRAVWDAFLGDLVDWMYLLAGAGAVIAAAASSLLRPVAIDAPVRWIAGALSRTPRSTVGKLARALALIVVGVVIALEPQAVINALIVVIGLYVAYLGVVELLRLTLPEESQDRAVRQQGRRAIGAAVVAAVVIIVAGAVFTQSGGTSQAPDAATSQPGCNGSKDLCDRPLNDVAFAATHNSMSAATNPNYLFAQQERGISDQLDDGIRGLLIDAHYGIPTQSGNVKTDVDAETSSDKIEEALGPQATQAALRIRDNIVNSPETGPRQVYFCHSFCELGALPIDKVFGQIRDFLAANPGQTLIIVVEDYVKPADIAAAANRTGLIDYIYKGALTPTPTLGDVSEVGSRAIFMAEHDDGGTAIPWYHSAYDSLVQETPYSFKKPADLLDKSKLTASCEPNRGVDTAPLFLINHWIDTSPSPRPSNAKKVNAHGPLLRRIRQCEKQRNLTANLVAVDFYREGDLFGVVDQLNSERSP